MFYINKSPNEFGNHGSPISNFMDGVVALPDELISSYIDTMGFAYITVENDVVIKLSLNKEAYESYERSIVEQQNEIHTEQDDINLMLVDLEYELTLLKLGL